MLNALSATPIYTNNNIITNLGAALIEGYIESENLRNTFGLSKNSK